MNVQSIFLCTISLIKQLTELLICFVVILLFNKCVFKCFCHLKTITGDWKRLFWEVTIIRNENKNV